MTLRVEQLEKFLSQLEGGGGVRFFAMALSGAERGQRYRERRRRGVVVVQIELGDEEFGVLADGGYLATSDAENSAAVGFAIRQALLELQTLKKRA